MLENEMIYSLGTPELGLAQWSIHWDFSSLP